MFSRLRSFSLRGLDVTWVDVEVSVSPGLPKFEIIGMPDTAIRESRERIFQSIRHFGYVVPPGNITVNLAPAEKQKRGSAFDLPIALGLLKASAQIQSDLELGNFLVAGELSLEGRLTRSGGIFNAALAALQDSFSGFLFPADNAVELESLSLPECGFARNLGEAIQILGGGKIETPSPSEARDGDSHQALSTEEKQEKPLDFGRIYGNELAVRAAQIAATAGMNLLLIGPPGCGKTLILRAMKGLRKPLAEQDRLEVTRIHSAAGLPVDGLLRLPPYREVHSNATLPALLGGGIFPMPGEISLAHKGTLVLDELSEFPRAHIQGLRVPLEEKRIILNRLASPIIFPSDFALAAATNPCPCGYYGDPVKACHCPPHRVNAFYQRISGPILDRIDLIIRVEAPKEGEIFGRGFKTTAELLSEMEGPRAVLEKSPGSFSPENLEKLLDETPWAQKILKAAYVRGMISLRRVRSILKTAKLLALFQEMGLREEHLYEALQLCRFKWESVLKD